MEMETTQDNLQDTIIYPHLATIYLRKTASVALVLLQLSTQVAFSWELAQERHSLDPRPQQLSVEHLALHPRPDSLQCSTTLLFCSKVPCNFDFIIFAQLMLSK